jgi:hypothetical protein
MQAGHKIKQLGYGNHQHHVQQMINYMKKSKVNFIKNTPNLLHIGLVY